MTAKQEIESLKAQVEELQERVKQLEARPYYPETGGCRYVPYCQYQYPYTVCYNNTSSGGSVIYS